MNAPLRHADTLAAASLGQTRKGTTARLLEALSAHEGDSDLGCLAHAILHGGDFYMRSYREEWEDAQGHVDRIEHWATEIADKYRDHAEFMAKGSA